MSANSESEIKFSIKSFADERGIKGECLGFANFLSLYKGKNPFQALCEISQLQSWEDRMAENFYLLGQDLLAIPTEGIEFDTIKGKILEFQVSNCQDGLIGVQEKITLFSLLLLDSEESNAAKILEALNASSEMGSIEEVSSQIMEILLFVDFGRKIGVIWKNVFGGLDEKQGIKTVIGIMKATKTPKISISYYNHIMTKLISNLEKSHAKKASFSDLSKDITNLFEQKAFHSFIEDES